MSDYCTIQERLCCGHCHSSLIPNLGGAKTGAQLYLSASATGGFWGVFLVFGTAQEMGQILAKAPLLWDSLL